MWLFKYNSCVGSRDLKEVWSKLIFYLNTTLVSVRVSPLICRTVFLFDLNTTLVSVRGTKTVL